MLCGNGWVSPRDSVTGQWETLCTTKPGVKTPVFNTTRCDIMAENIPRCAKLIDLCYDSLDAAVCNVAFDVCYSGFMYLYFDEVVPGGRNTYDSELTFSQCKLCS